MFTDTNILCNICIASCPSEALEPQVHHPMRQSCHPRFANSQKDIQTPAGDALPQEKPAFDLVARDAIDRPLNLNKSSVETRDLLSSNKKVESRTYASCMVFLKPQKIFKNCISSPRMLWKIW